MKYKIEIERIDPEGPRPWEWRIYHAEDGQPFRDEPDVSGSRPTAQRALDEADITLGLRTPEERE